MIDTPKEPRRNYEHRYDSASLQAYDKYFDECERANKIPLTYDKWKDAQSARKV